MTTATQKHYAAHLASIGERLTKLLDWNLRSQETTEDFPIDWRDVGDAAHINDLLAMACEFLEMEPETPHPNHAGVKYAVYLSPKQGEAAMILGDGSVNAGIVKALDLADHVGVIRSEPMTPPLPYSTYDWYIRELVATVQAFINHARHPSTFGLPDLDKAEYAWRTANDFNVQTADSARCQVCGRPDMLGYICEGCYEDRCA